MKSFDDETFERELFALRADALPPPSLGAADVFLRADRLARAKVQSQARSASVAWFSAVACAAASYLCVMNAHETQVVTSAPEAAANVADTSEEATDSETLTCSPSLVSRVAGMCKSPAMNTLVATAADPRLVCEDEVTFSSQRP